MSEEVVVVDRAKQIESLEKAIRDAQDDPEKSLELRRRLQILKTGQ